jgi:hypothetical protein
MNDLIKSFYYIFSLIYTFKVWGFWWGMLGTIFPVFPLIDGAWWVFEKLIN